MLKIKKINKIENISKFRPLARKINIQLEDKYDKNGKNTQIRKMYDNFCFSV